MLASTQRDAIIEQFANEIGAVRPCDVIPVKISEPRKLKQLKDQGDCLSVGQTQAAPH